MQALKNELEEYGFVSGLDGLVSTREKEAERIKLSKEGNLPKGLKTGFDILDIYFRFKLGNLVIINGHSNVGKSFLVWYLMVISYKHYGWRWILFCGENKSADIREQLVEFLAGSLSQYISNDLFNAFLSEMYEAFVIIEIDESMDVDESLDSLLKISERVIDERGDFQGLLIDPYNSVDIDIQKLDKRLSTHDFHYMNAKKLRKFCAKHNMTTWVNMHAISNALRFTDEKGYPKPPMAADTEGGGKFSNRSDEFMTFHRYVQDSERSMTTEIHVRKVKDTKTGGCATDLDSPVNLHWQNKNGFCGFYDDKGICSLMLQNLKEKH